MLVESSTVMPGTEYWSGYGRIAQSIDQRMPLGELASPNFLSDITSVPSVYEARFERVGGAGEGTAALEK